MTQDSPPPLRVVHSLPPADASADYRDDDWMVREAARQRLRAEAAEARAYQAEQRAARAELRLRRLFVLTQAQLSALSGPIGDARRGPGDVW